MEQYLVFIGAEIFLIDGEDLGIYAANFPNAVFAQVVGDEIYGYDVKALGLMEKARLYLAGLREVQVGLDEIEF